MRTVPILATTLLLSGAAFANGPLAPLSPPPLPSDVGQPADETVAPAARAPAPSAANLERYSLLRVTVSTLGATAFAAGAATGLYFALGFMGSVAGRGGTLERLAFMLVFAGGSALAIACSAGFGALALHQALNGTGDWSTAIKGALFGVALLIPGIFFFPLLLAAPLVMIILPAHWLEESHLSNVAKSIRPVAMPTPSGGMVGLATDF
ncbi:MAG: hypothetical protein ACOZIN_21565 [Myxococcota bacterium]